MPINWILGHKPQQPVGRRHPFYQDHAYWSQTPLFVKIMTVGCRHTLLSRPCMLVTDAPFVMIMLVDHRCPVRQDQASW